MNSAQSNFSRNSLSSPSMTSSYMNSPYLPQSFLVIFEEDESGFKTDLDKDQTFEEKYELEDKILGEVSFICHT